MLALYEKWQKKNPRKLQTSGIISTLCLNENNLVNEGSPAPALLDCSTSETRI